MFNDRSIARFTPHPRQTNSSGRLRRDVLDEDASLVQDRELLVELLDVRIMAEIQRLPLRHSPALLDEATLKGLCSAVPINQASFGPPPWKEKFRK